MSDLLERLRHPVFILEDGFSRLHIAHTLVAMTEAHAEIERLRAEVERLSGDLEATVTVEGVGGGQDLPPIDRAPQPWWKS